MERKGAHNQLGQQGENLAAEFLVGRGYKLLKRNNIMPMGEIDLLMKDGEDIVLVEVKTVRQNSAFDPALRMDYKKRRKYLTMAKFIQEEYPDCNIRVDLVTIWGSGDMATLKHYQNALGQ